MNLGISPAQVKMAMSILFGGILLLACLNGFHRGTKKSIYYMICTIVVLVLTCLFSDAICNKLLSIDISGLGLSIETGGETIEVVTANEAIKSFVSINLLGGSEAATSTTLNVAMAFVHAGFRFVFFVVTFILAFTIYKIFFDIIWLFLRPKKEVNNKGKRRRPKPSIISRLGGLGIGLVKGFLYCFIIFSAFAGVSSIANIYKDTINQINGAEEVTPVVFDGKGSALVKLDKQKKFDPLAKYSDALNLASAYSDSAAGKMLGAVKVGGTSLDEKIFDATFAVKGDVSKDKSFNMNIREEISNVAKVACDLGPALKDGLSLETILALPQENLESIFDSVSKLEIFNVALPAVVEVAVKGDIAEKVLGKEASGMLANVNLAEFKSKDFGEEIKKIGDIVVDFAESVKENFMDENGKINLRDANGNLEVSKLLSMDCDAFDELFDYLGDSTLVQDSFQGIIDYVVTLAPAGLTLVNPETWSKEAVSAMFDLLSFATDKGITESIIENPDLGSIFAVLNSLTEEDIHTLSTDIASIEFVTMNIDPIIVYLNNNMLNDILVNPLDLTNVSWNQTEIDSLLMTAFTCYKLGIFEDAENMIKQNIKDLSNDNLKEIAKAASSSIFMKNNIINVINSIAEKFELGISSIPSKTFSSDKDVYALELEEILVDLQSAIAK